MKMILFWIVQYIIVWYATHSACANGNDAAVLSELFSRNSEEKCTSNRRNNDCKNKEELDGKAVENNRRAFGPKFQRVHLELPRINPVRTGFTRKAHLIEGKTHEMKTLSIHPPIFEIKNFLSHDECDAIIELAKEKGMKQATTAAKDLNLPNRNSHLVFDKWDRNLDGSLSNEEVSAIEEIKHLLLTDEDIKNMYEDLELKADENGHISYGELEKLSFAKFSSYLKKLHEKKENSSIHQIEQTWLWHDEDELLVYDDVLQKYHERLSNLTRIPKSIIEESEPILITKFKNGSFTECRHDSAQTYANIPCCVFGTRSKCRACRFISIMYFLNDVSDGELLFPLADNKTYDWNDLHRHTASVCSKTPNVSLSNLVIKPEKGKAIMWYNHYIGRDTGWMSSLDPLSFYGTNKIAAMDKWVATTWVNIIGEGVTTLRPWRMGCNWLSENNKNKRVIESMRNDDFIEGEVYLHDAKLTAIDNDDNDVHAINGGLWKDEAVKVGGEAMKRSQIVRDTLLREAREDETKKEKIKSDNKSDIDDRKEIESRRDVVIETSKSKMPSEVRSGDFQQSTNRRTSKVDEMQQRKEMDKISEKQNDTKNSPSGRRNRSPSNGEGPLGPPVRNLSQNSNDVLSTQNIKNRLHYSLQSGKIIENRVVASVLMLIEELDRDELEIIARTLHERLQLACIPIMVNPIGPM